MRSVGLWPDNPWPHDMVIRIDETPNALLTLLFVRAAWELAPEADVPDLDPHPSCGASAAPATATREQWSERWVTVWDRAWAWYGPPGAGPRPPAAEPGPLRPDDPQGASIWWEAEHGLDGIDRDALRRWKATLREPRPVPLDREPERRNLDALIPAWRAGIDSVLVLPYRGYYARRVGARHLVVSRTTRDDPALYDRAPTSVV